MIKFDKLILVSNTKKSHLGLGEYLRIASFLPNIKCNEIIWYCNQKLKKLIKEVDYLNKIISITSFNKKKFTNKDILINLTEQKIESQAKTLNILSYSQDKKSFKSKTKNLLSIIANELKIKKYKIFTNKKKYFKKKIFINWKVPKEWKIKSYPKAKWQKVIRNIKKEKKVKIEWQKNNGDLKYLIKQIKDSTLVISVVSLSCHLAILFNKKLITLSGPNFFDDLNLYKKSKVIFTKKKCSIHKKTMNVKYARCNCMKFIDEKEIYKLALNEI